jgi:motility quorum-sensing regulator / GCU-specific mRNA interferase toxin
VEKKRAHYSLRKIKDLIKSGNAFVTKKAQYNALESFGFDLERIYQTVLELNNNDFYKSMTSHQNTKLWHDVYKKKMNPNYFYIELQIFEMNALIISFKEVESSARENVE